MTHLDKLLDGFTTSIEAQCKLCGTMSVCNKYIGAPLVSTETGENVGVTEIERAVMEGNEAIAVKDVATGLLIPGPSIRMKTADGTTERVPPNHVINPKTGHVVPMEGNICFDPVSLKMIFTCDAIKHEECILRDDPLIPYLPYPLNPETGQPVETGLKAPEKPANLKYGGPMKDPKTGLIVPISAVTVHPVTHLIMPVGGTSADPVTGLPVPIEVGSMMIDPNTDMPVPTVGVSIDQQTGAVLPVGGSIAIQDIGASTLNHKTILLGEQITEPLSQLPVRVTSAFKSIQDTQIVCSSGGYQTYADCTELSQEKHVIECFVYLKDLSKAIDVASAHEEQEISLISELQKAQAMYKELMQSRTKNQAYHLRSLHCLLVKKEISDKVGVSGGSPGYMEFKPTGQPLPLLLGLSIPDPTEGKQIPVLGYELNPVTRIATPLAGTMESIEGDGSVPIMIGEKTLDQSTGEVATVCGIRRNMETDIVVPVLQDSDTSMLPQKRKFSESVVSLLCLVCDKNSCFLIILHR